MFYSIPNETKLHCKTPQNIHTVKNYKHNDVGSLHNIIVSHFAMTNLGTYVFRVRVIKKALQYNAVSIMNCPQDYVSFLNQCKHDPSEYQIDTFWNGELGPVSHDMFYVRNKDVLELVLTNGDSGTFKLEVYRNGSLAQQEVIYMDKRKGPFYPCVLFGHKRNVSSMAEFQL